MLLHELRSETQFATPEDRSRVFTLKGMFPGGSCVVLTPEGDEIQMEGSTVVVVPELPRVGRGSSGFKDRFRLYVLREKGWI